MGEATKQHLLRDDHRSTYAGVTKARLSDPLAQAILGSALDTAFVAGS